MDPTQQNAKQQIVDRLKGATNILVTVNNNPSVDQLAGAIGLTLLLNKIGKHGTAVFSGDPPSTVEFLEPEKTLERNTDSLRDFIIALDKSKADKLRYKVEEKVVKIFITPYRTSLSKDDLEFSQGDFNVDVVIALGVQKREELDQAITGQARILHDATVISISNKFDSDVGSINWQDPGSSSLCEMLVFLGEAIKSEFLDAQMATAFLTGIVAETDRFSNDKTTPRTMTIAGRLMTAGANQQLIATKLEEPETLVEPELDLAPVPEPESQSPEPATEPEPLPPAENAEAPPEPEPTSEEPPSEPDAVISNDGTLDILHEGEAQSDEQVDSENLSSIDIEEDEDPKDPIHIDEHGTIHHADDVEIGQALEQSNASSQPSATEDKPSNSLMPPLEPPIMSGAMTAATEPDPAQLTDDVLSLPPIDAGENRILSHNAPPASPPPSPYTPPIDDGKGKQTLSELEASLEGTPDTVKQPVGQDETPPPDVDDARDAVKDAIVASPDTDHLEPIQGLSAQPVDLDLGHESNLSNQSAEPDVKPKNKSSGPSDPAAPPPVPPPFVPPPMPPSGGLDSSSMASASNPFTLPPVM